MTEINDLRERVEAAEKRFGLIDEQQSHYSERVIGLIEAIEAQLAAARSEIENQIAENRQLTEDNEELRGMLHSVLRSIEEKTFTQTLQNLEARVSALVEINPGEAEVAAALSAGLAREEMSAEDLLAEEAAPEASDDPVAEDGIDAAPAESDAETLAEAADEAEGLGEAEALVDAEVEAEAAVDAPDPLIVEASEEEAEAAETPAEDLAEAAPEALAAPEEIAAAAAADEMDFDEAPTGEAPTEEAPTGEAPTGEAPTEDAPGEEAVAAAAFAEEAPAEEAPAEEACGEEAFGEETAAAEIAEEIAEETVAEDIETGQDAIPDAMEMAEDPAPEAEMDVTAAPAESDDDDSVHDLLAAMAVLRASDVADAAILEANPEIAKLMEEAKALEAACADESDLAEAEAGATAQDDAAMAEPAGDALSMEAPEGAAAAAPEAAEPADEPAAGTTPTVKEIIRRVGDLARELERAEAQRRTSLDAAEKQAAAESESAAALDHAASA